MLKLYQYPSLIQIKGYYLGTNWVVIVAALAMIIPGKGKLMVIGNNRISLFQLISDNTTSHLQFTLFHNKNLNDY